MKQVKRRRAEALTTGALLAVLSLVALPALAQPGAVRGRVLSPDGAPLEKVAVTVATMDGELAASATTNRKGKFSLKLEDAGVQHFIQLEKDGFKTLQQWLERVPDGVLEKTWTLVPGEGEIVELEEPAVRQRKAAAVRTYNEGAAAYNSGDPETALAKFEAAVAEDPELLAAWAPLAVLYLQNDRPEEALEAIDKVLAREPEKIEALRLAYEAHSALGHREEASAVIERLIALQPGRETAVLLFNQGVRAIRAGDMDQGLRHIARSVEVFPGFVQGYETLCDLYLRAGRWQPALEAAEGLLELRPRSLKGLSTRYEALAAIGEVAAAEAAREDLLREYPEVAAEQLYREGEATFRAGDPERAAAIFRRILGVLPEHARAHYQLGLCLASLGRLEEARRELERFLELAPDDSEASMARSMLDGLE